ncbi:unnamed protein product, partial [marine sediment metagenome]
MKLPGLPGKGVIAGIIWGFVIGSLLYLISIGINNMLNIWAAGTEAIFFIIGFAAMIVLGLY